MKIWNRYRIALLVLVFVYKAYPQTVGSSFDTNLHTPSGRMEVQVKESPEIAFLRPDMTGNFKIGIIRGKESLWGDKLKNVDRKPEGTGFIYTLFDPLFDKGVLVMEVCPLPDTDGVIVKLIANGIPDNTDFLWSFGGAYGKVVSQSPALLPEFCKDNVFSVEGNAFTVYYGESMGLKRFMGIVPPGSEIRLSDAYRQESPLEYFNSGKKTDAPALAGTFRIVNGEEYYFCFYRQNRTADYNYFMLKGLFIRNSTH